ncbi:MAG: hypothetical protein ACREQF_00625 [Candidatus Binataceae bacterium]
MVPRGLLLDLQPTLANAPVVNSKGVLGRLDEREFRAVADRVNAALRRTITAALFALEREVVVDLVHRFSGSDELLTEVQTWTGTKIPPLLVRRVKRSAPPFDVREGARLRRLRAL